MSQDDFERIHPAAIEISAPAAARSARRAGVPVTALALGALLALAAGVIFVLPDFVAGQRARPAPSASAPPPAATPAAVPATGPAPSATAPYAEAQAERERAAAKSALEALLATQYELQQRAVEKWAATEFAAATAQATAGDAAYKAGAYPDAEEQYHAARQAMQALLDGSSARLEDRIARAGAALVADDAATATTLYSEALAIDAASAAAQRGLARAAKRGEVLALMARASQADAAAESSTAASAYRAALALDADYAPAREALAALEARVAAGSYNARLSAGYAALAAGRLADAHGAFQAALKIRPGGAEARDGLQQAEFQLAQQRIGELLRQAEQAVAAEDWAAAAGHYGAVLAIDATLSTAREGKQAAETRLALDQALAQIAREPQRLNSEKTRAAAAKLIEGAAAIANPGPRLQAQLASASKLLADYSTPVRVRLRSDGKTEVTVFRVGAFGPVTEKTLELMPGNYVAVGQRGGYRDVRVEFSVAAGQAAADVTVQCVQKI